MKTVLTDKMTQSLVIVITAMLALSEAFATKNNQEEKEDQISTEVSFLKDKMDISTFSEFSVPLPCLLDMQTP